MLEVQCFSSCAKEAPSIPSLTLRPPWVTCPASSHTFEETSQRARKGLAKESSECTCVCGHLLPGEGSTIYTTHTRGMSLLGLLRAELIDRQGGRWEARLQKKRRWSSFGKAFCTERTKPPPSVNSLDWSGTVIILLTHHCPLSLATGWKSLVCHCSFPEPCHRGLIVYHQSCVRCNFLMN